MTPGHVTPRQAPVSGACTTLRAMHASTAKRVTTATLPLKAARVSIPSALPVPFSLNEASNASVPLTLLLPLVRAPAPPPECMCDPVGTFPWACSSPEGCECDQHSGQCPCKSNVEGQNCNRCAPDTWSISSGTGCQKCDCDAVHSFGSSCNEASPSPTHGGSRNQQPAEFHMTYS